MGVDAAPTAPPTFGIYLCGLCIHNASWDSGRGVLREMAPGEDKQQPMPLLWLKPIDMTMSSHHMRRKQPMYDCPVYMDGNSQCLAAQHVITSVDLPTTVPPSVWAQKPVYLSSQ